MILLNMVNFEGIVFEVYWAFSSFKSFSKFGTFSAIIFSNFFITNVFPPASFYYANDIHVTYFENFPQIPRSCYFSRIFPFYSEWVMPSVLSSRSLAFSSAISIWLLSFSREFLLQILYFSVQYFYSALKKNSFGFWAENFSLPIGFERAFLTS